MTMEISYQAEDEEGVTYEMRDVYPVYYTDSKTPRLYLFTVVPHGLNVSVYHDGEMKHYEYPARAEPLIKRSLESCKGLALLSKLMESKKEQAKALN